MPSPSPGWVRVRALRTNSRRLLPWFLPALSGGLWVFLMFCYASRADGVAALTLAPAWCWPLPLALLGGVRVRKRRVRALWCLWLVFSLCFVDELRPLSHPQCWLSAPVLEKKSPGTWRVVSLNCAGGDPKAADEVVAWQPDVVLLQETPSPSAVRALAKRLFGSERACVLGYDTAVLARDLEPIALPQSLQRYVAAAQTPHGRVVSVRLSPCVLRADLWSPSCWQEQTQSRRLRREQLEAALVAIPAKGPVLFGGDLNVPAGEGIFSKLSAQGLTDTWPWVGLGWGDTIANDFPVHRIDQLWMRELNPRALIAVTTQSSDHRMVVCDVTAPRPTP